MTNKITLLGTGTSVGVPMIGCNCEVCFSTDSKDKRLRTSALVNFEQKKFLIDIGPDFRYQALKYEIKNLDAILLTHPHRDHIAGYDDLRGLNFSLNKSIPIFSNSFTYLSLKKQFYYAFDNKDYDAVPKSEWTEIIGNEILHIEKTSILPIQLMHGKMPCIGYRFGKMAFLTDVNHISDEQQMLLQNLDVLILDSLRTYPHHSHFSLDESIELAQKLKPKKTFFIHISHHMGKHAEVEKNLPDTIYLGYDGLEIEF